jgi:hypothetical protein
MGKITLENGKNYQAFFSLSQNSQSPHIEWLQSLGAE